MAAKTILITGGNRGIGLGIVQRLAQRSSTDNIIIACRKKEDAEQAITDLQKMGHASPFHALALDVTNDDSIRTAVAEVEERYGKLDVLINNAGIAFPEGDDPSSYRQIWSQIFNTNVFSVRITSELFFPLLRQSSSPRIINVSSARGSFDRVVTGKNPSTTNCPYSVCKAALNMLTLDMANREKDIAFYAVSPGYCRTAFNGFRGVKDPVDGGSAAAELTLAKRGMYGSGSFWEDEGKGMVEVGW